MSCRLSQAGRWRSRFPITEPWFWKMAIGTGFCECPCPGIRWTTRLSRNPTSGSQSGRQLPTIFCRSGQVTGTTAIAKNGQSSVLDRGAASPDQKSFVARSPAVTLAAAAHHLAVPFFRLSGTFSGKSKREQISGKLPPIGIGKAAPLVLSRSTFVYGKACYQNNVAGVARNAH